MAQERSDLPVIEIVIDNIEDVEMEEPPAGITVEIPDNAKILKVTSKGISINSKITKAKNVKKETYELQWDDKLTVTQFCKHLPRAYRNHIVRQKGKFYTAKIILPDTNEEPPMTIEIYLTEKGNIYQGKLRTQVEMKRIAKGITDAMGEDLPITAITTNKEVSMKQLTLLMNMFPISPFSILDKVLLREDGIIPPVLTTVEVESVETNDSKEKKKK